ncbi:hypothetical protein J8J14_05405 [Roseomonas sp. SSH11]|uniref:Tetratricopeptide repeat protein n=1 Tax=Pararoseomonas baculiformis TaxID=2820812 RepID=A0ABS4AB26_9PROT|nr:hypothetical protein [Pararoseomonas baculiformis]MBP0444209.1 hypothetical protein [Pararoseomonas baculiformis]
MAIPAIEAVFEDAELVVRAIPGDPTKPTLVTFGDYPARPFQPGFWAIGPASRLGWPALGFVAHRPNWYPAASMAAAAAALRGRIGPVALGYGYSMGGYAALKHGRLLGLTHALALSPQASIAPADLPGDTRYHAHFDPALHAGMRVGAGEPPVRAWMLFDPAHAADALNAGLLAPLGPRPVPVRGVYHGTIRLLAGQEPFEAALDALLRDDLPALRRMLRARRRETPFWRIGMGTALLSHGHVAAGDALFEQGRAMGAGLDAEVEVLGEALETWRLRGGGRRPAAALIQRLLACEGLTPAAHLDRSLKLAALGMLAESRRAAKAALAEGAALPALLTHLGHLHLLEGMPDLAHGLLEDSARQAPEAFWTWVGVSVARLRTGDPEGAEEAARRAIALQPGNHHTHLAHGDALLALRRPEEAAEVFRRAAGLGGGEGAAMGLARAERQLRAKQAPGDGAPVTKAEAMRATAARIAAGYPDPVPPRAPSLLARLFRRAF